MKSRMRMVLVLAAVACIGAGIALWRITKSPDSLPGLSPRDGASGSSWEFLNAQRAAGFYKDEIQKHPGNVKNYVQLAQLFQQEARVTGRHHEYIPKAMALLDQAQKIDPGDVSAVVARASLLMTLHQFAEARQLAERPVSPR